MKGQHKGFEKWAVAITSVPSTCESPVRGKDAHFQRCAVMGAVRAHGMGFVTLLDQEDLAILNAFDLHFTLFTIFQIKARETFELIFLSHDS